jgi:hypothetical protein
VHRNCHETFFFATVQFQFFSLNMSAAGNNISVGGVKALHNEMIKNFIAASLVEAPHNDLLQSYGDE